jgi:hypothetical protein
LLAEGNGGEGEGDTEYSGEESGELHDGARKRVAARKDEGLDEYPGTSYFIAGDGVFGDMKVMNYGLYLLTGTVTSLNLVRR